MRGGGTSYVWSWFSVYRRKVAERAKTYEKPGGETVKFKRLLGKLRRQRRELDLLKEKVSEDRGTRR